MKHHLIALTLGLAAGTGMAFLFPPFPEPPEKSGPVVPREAPAVRETASRSAPAAVLSRPSPEELRDMTPEQRGAFFAQETAALYELVLRDPEAAARRSRGRFDPWGPVNEVLVAAVSRDALAALRGLEAEPQEHLRRQQRLDFIRAAALTDPVLARDQLAKLDGVQERVFAIGAIAAGMARRDPAEAARWYLENHEHPTGEDPLAEVAAHYLAKDPKGALEWTMRLRDADQRTAMRTLVKEWMALDYPGLMTEVTALPEGAGRAALHKALAETLGRDHPEQTLEWAESLQGRERADALLGLAGRPPADLAALQRSHRILEELLASPDSAEYSGAVEQALSTLAPWRSNGGPLPETNTAWLAALPDESMRNTSLRWQFGVWGKGDPEGMARWLAAQPRGEVRQLATDSLAGSVAIGKPAKAFALSLELENPARRQEMLVHSVGMWRHKDTEAARRAIEAAPLEPAARAELLKTLAQPVK